MLVAFLIALGVAVDYAIHSTPRAIPWNPLPV